MVLARRKRSLYKMCVGGRITSVCGPSVQIPIVPDPFPYTEFLICVVPTNLTLVRGVSSDGRFFLKKMRRR